MIGGTSGSERKLWKPSSSQSKSTQTRSSSLGSRKTFEPVDPCCFRFSAPLVEKIVKNWSKSSTVVVARNISFLLGWGPARPPYRPPGRPLSTPFMRTGSGVGSRVAPTESRTSTMRADENVATMQRAYDAFNAGDVETLTEVFDESAVWH